MHHYPWHPASRCRSDVARPSAIASMRLQHQRSAPGATSPAQTREVCMRNSRSAASAWRRWDHYRAAGRHLLHRASQPLSPAQVGIGMLLRSLPDQFLDDTSAARRDWMVGLFELVLLLDCNPNHGHVTDEVNQIPHRRRPMCCCSRRARMLAVPQCTCAASKATRSDHPYTSIRLLRQVCYCVQCWS